MCPTIDQIIFATDLSATARLVFQALVWHRNRKTGQCNPRLGTLARELGLCKDTIWRAMNELRARGCIMSQKGQRGCVYGFAPSASMNQKPRTENQDAEPAPAYGKSVRTRPENQYAEAPASLLNLLELKKTVPAADADVKLQAVPSSASSAVSPAALEEKNGTQHMPEVVAHPVSHPHKPGILFPTYADDVRELHRDLVAVHPMPGLPERALSGLQTIVDASGDRTETLKTVRTNHGLWREFWATLPPERFIPQLWRWLRDGEWRIPPIVRKGASAEESPALRWLREHRGEEA
jgi:biotin operon repressor